MTPCNASVIINLMKNVAISDIHDMLPKLPVRRIREVRDYISFLVEKEKKHRTFVKRVLEAEKEPTMVFETVNEAMQAILNAPED
ncbi:MAG: hypothetical protein C0392_05345 [Syntrophus sp. (in: bacteria)]|nr:hypothetical protein [Syntrophus sp. (in: bacteria)]